jgi:hypothetical protein
MRKLAILLLLLCLAGCGGGPLSFAVDTEFNDTERALIISAVDEWVIATDSDEAAAFLRFDLEDETFDKKKHWDDYDGDYGVIYKIHTYEPGYIDWMKERNPFSGIASRDPDRIAMVAEKTADPEKFRAIMMHELGHIYGISHQDSGLMIGGEVPPNCIDQLALDLYCEEHHCGPNAAPTCKE